MTTVPNRYVECRLMPASAEDFDVRRPGFWFCQKRLSQGRFTWWPSPGRQPTLGLDVHQLQLLLWNGNPASAQAAPMWRAITPPVGEGGRDKME